MKKILCIGTATIDIIMVIPDENIEKMNLSNALSSFLLLETGRKLEAESVNWFYGGGAINAAVAIKKLGLEADCLAKIGNDDYGNNIIKYLSKLSIGTEHIIKSQRYQTATSILIASHDRDPTILTYRGANTRVTEEEIIWSKILEYDAIYITNLSSQSAKIYAPLIGYAHRHEVKIISNPGIRQISNSTKDFLRLFGKINMFVINRVEAEELLILFLENELVTPVKKREGNTSLSFLQSDKMMVSLEDFLAAMAALGVELCVITDGKNGAHLYHQHRYYHIEAEPIEAIGTVGAGDAFSSTLAALWLRGMDIKKAGELAVQNAMSVVKALDAQSGLLTYDELTQGKNNVEADTSPRIK